jgi:hypothetical protein
MRSDKGNQNAQRKPAPLPLCPPQIPDDLIWDQTGVASVGSWRLATAAMAQSERVIFAAFTLLDDYED